MTEEVINAHDPHPRAKISVLDGELSYVDTGAGAPIVFLHGNPTSATLWRNIITPLAAVGRCLAPDLIGMGDSGPAPGGSYRFVDHARYLDAWFEAVGLEEPVCLVVHDWGSALGFHWARRHPERVRALVFMEAIVTPLSWQDWPEAARQVFQGMRSEAGEVLVLEKNVFVERILPASILRDLSDEEMQRYRKPYTAPGASRLPTLTWPREIPIDGEPADVVEIVQAYGQWLAQSSLPKLFVNAKPGSILVGRQREVCRSWPNLKEVTVPGLHFIQEDSPAQIAGAIGEFLEGI